MHRFRFLACFLLCLSIAIPSDVESVAQESADCYQACVAGYWGFDYRGTVFCGWAKWQEDLGLWLCDDESDNQSCPPDMLFTYHPGYCVASVIETGLDCRDVEIQYTPAFVGIQCNLFGPYGPFAICSCFLIGVDFNMPPITAEDCFLFSCDTD